MGFLPQELLGTSMYEYYHHDDIPHLAESHKAALQTPERITTQVINMNHLQSLFCNDTRIKIIIISVVNYLFRELIEYYAFSYR